MHRPNKKQHATAPSYVRERRHRHAKIERAERLEARLARARAKRAGVICLPGPMSPWREDGSEAVALFGT
jgi:hypothetical protein